MSKSERLSWPPAADDDFEVVEIESEPDRVADPMLVGGLAPRGEGDHHGARPNSAVNAGGPRLKPLHLKIRRVVPPDGPRDATRRPAAPVTSRQSAEPRKSGSRWRPERIALVLLLLVVVGQTAYIATRNWGSGREPENASIGAVPAGTSGAVAPDAVNAPAASERADILLTPPTALVVRTDPPGGKVSVDGEAHGEAPITLSPIDPGEHEVVVEGRGGVARHRVMVASGEMTSFVLPLPAGPAGGWLVVESPVELRVQVGKRVVGTSVMPRVSMGAGTHRVVLLNEELGFRSAQPVRIRAGQTTTVRPRLPDGRLAVNAIPWAEVWVDGERVGETPVGTLSLRIGPHRVTLRHPEFGQRTVTAVVKAGEPTRLAVDMRNQ